jgi:hypothetical protein
MFRRKKGPNRAFAHSDGCKILAADPPSRSSGRRSRLGIGGGSASAGPRTSTRSLPTVVFGSTRSMRRPPAT